MCKFKIGQKVKVKNKNEIIKWLKENSYELYDNGKLWRRYSSLSFNIEYDGEENEKFEHWKTSKTF